MTRASDFSERALKTSLSRPRVELRAPWWDSLPLDFSQSSEPFELKRLEGIKVGATAAADVVLRTLGAALVGSLALPLGYNPLGIWRALRDRAFYADLVRGGSPDRFYETPPRGIRFLRRRARMPLFSPDDGACEDVRFESPFVPVNPRERKRYLFHARNRFAHARHWRHHAGPRSTIVAFHGFSADLYHFNEWFFAIPELYKAGFDILLVTLPFHGRRQTAFSPFSGHGFFAGGTARINEAFAQAIYDIRIFIDALFDEGAPQVGATGMSLGGLTTSLLASVDKRLAFAIPNVPVVSIADLVLEWQPIASVIKTSLSALGKDVRVAREMLAPSCPLSFQPRLPRERLMVIGGVGDRLAPPRHARLLWDHWDRPALHWFPGSHVLHLDRGEYFRAMKDFLHAIEFRP